MICFTKTVGKTGDKNEWETCSVDLNKLRQLFSVLHILWNVY